MSVAITILIFAYLTGCFLRAYWIYSRVVGGLMDSRLAHLLRARDKAVLGAAAVLLSISWAHDVIEFSINAVKTFIQEKL